MVKAIFTNKKLMIRILITIGFLLLFRMGTLITIPGSSLASTAYDPFNSSGSFLGVLNLLGGGGLSTFSIFALGVTPYITASIIIQLLSSDVVPYLSRLNKQGEKGRIKVEKITRVLTLFLALIQGAAIVLAMFNGGYITSLGFFGDQQWIDVLIFTIILTAGSFITIWIADQITMKGVGNGTSLIIFTGIVAIIPNQILDVYNSFIPSPEGVQAFTGWMSMFIYALMIAILIFGMGWIETSERRIPIQQTGQGLNLLEDNQTYLPMKMNPAGIIPVIFATAIITLPPTIAQFFPDTSSGRYFVETWFDLSHPFGLSLYAILIISFTYFYSHVNINPQQTAENFEKSSTFIMGVKPGKETEKYLTKKINFMATLGAFYLAFIACLPFIMGFMGVSETLAIGGTGLIIMVTVALDTSEQIKARALAGIDKDRAAKKAQSVPKGSKGTKTNQKEEDLLW